MTIFNKLNFFSRFNNRSNLSYPTKHHIAKADGNLVRYFQVEYGSEWKSALAQHLYQKKINNVKKAA